ncbi:hypothetical protein NL516_26680, partial [Klebsiella pneumoniae]|nr:hypothetical protein [Klebsiella pneumoniae]
AAVLIAIGLGTAYFLNEDKHETHVAINKPAATIPKPENATVTNTDTAKDIAAVKPQIQTEAQQRIGNTSMPTAGQQSGITENVTEPVIA